MRYGGMADGSKIAMKRVQPRATMLTRSSGEHGGSAAEDVEAGAVVERRAAP